jgi:hypothetical protein
LFDASRDPRLITGAPSPGSSNARLRSRASHSGTIPRLGYRDGSDAHRLHVTDVVQREEAAVGRDDIGHVTEDTPVMFHRRDEQLRVVLGHDRDIGYHAALSLLHIDHLA